MVHPVAQHTNRTTTGGEFDVCSGPSLSRAERLTQLALAPRREAADAPEATSPRALAGA